LGYNRKGFERNYDTKTIIYEVFKRLEAQIVESYWRSYNIRKPNAHLSTLVRVLD